MPLIWVKVIYKAAPAIDVTDSLVLYVWQLPPPNTQSTLKNKDCFHYVVFTAHFY
jgi:hypothetical protein